MAGFKKNLVRRELTITLKSHNNNFPSVVFTLLRFVYYCLWPACACVRVCAYIYTKLDHFLIFIFELMHFEAYDFRNTVITLCSVLYCYNYRTEPHMLQDQGLCKARASHNLRMELKETLHTVSNPKLR